MLFACMGQVFEVVCKLSVVWEALNTLCEAQWALIHQCYLHAWDKPLKLFAKCQWCERHQIPYMRHNEHSLQWAFQRIECFETVHHLVKSCIPSICSNMILSYIHKLKVLILSRFTTANIIGTLSLLGKGIYTIVIHNIKCIPVFVSSLYDQGTLGCPSVTYPINQCKWFMVEDVASN